MKNKTFNVYIEPENSLDFLNKLQDEFDKNSPIHATIKYRLWINDRFLVERFYPILRENQILYEEFMLDCSLLNDRLNFKIETFSDFTIRPKRFINLDFDENLRFPNTKLICKKLTIDSHVTYPNTDSFSCLNQ
jgi:hypothetical protein